MSLGYKSFEKGPCLSDLLIHEIHPNYSRESVLIPNNADALPMGTVLKAAEGDAYTIFDGTGSAAAVLATEVPAGATIGTALVRGVVLSEAALQWKSGTTEEHKAAAIASLKALTIIVRSDTDA